MLQIATSSLEPLRLDTFMQAVNFVLQNKAVYTADLNKSAYTSDLQYEFVQNSQIGPTGIMDSEASQLRRLSSRTGGILETFVTISEESSADDKAKVASGLPLGSSAKEDATIHTVQFLHATAKEFIQGEQRKLLLGNVDSVLASLDGHDLLLLCCASIDLWVLPISKHMFYYLKMAELHDTDCARNKARFFIWGTIDALPAGANNLKWLLSQFKGHFCSRLMQHPNVSVSRFGNSDDYKFLVLAVAANAKKLAKHVIDFSDVMTRDPSLNMDQFCLLHVAAAGPDLVPIELQDRTGMIQILVSSGYPIHHDATSRTDNLNINDGFSDRMTPFQAVLIRRIDSAYSEDTRLDILKCLLDQGSAVDKELDLFPGAPFTTTPLVYGVQNDSVAVVRLLLEYEADTSFSDSYGMQPIDYALIRQDKAIIKALADHGCVRPMPRYTPSVDTALNSGIRQSILMGSIGHPMAAIVSTRDSRPLVSHLRRHQLPYLQTSSSA